MNDSNKIRIAKEFINEAINEAKEIIQGLEFYKNYIDEIEDHETRLNHKIDTHIETIKFKLSKSKQWYMAEKKLKDAEKFKGSRI